MDCCLIYAFSYVVVIIFSRSFHDMHQTTFWGEKKITERALVKKKEQKRKTYRDTKRGDRDQATK